MSSFSVLLLVFDQVPLVDGRTRARPSWATKIADGEILMLERALGIDRTRTTTSANRMARRVSLVESFSAVSVILARRRKTGGIEQLTSRPFQVKSLATASRVSPGSGPRDHAILAEECVDQRGLAGIGAGRRWRRDSERSRRASSGFAAVLRAFSIWLRGPAPQDSDAPRSPRP